MCPDAAPRWEYRVVKPPREPSKKEARDPTTALNEAAADGWELDATIEYVGGGTKFLVLRRPAEGVAETGDAEADDAEDDD
ncbi:DUF4177 domain-containing protein [Halorussus aquaticus]|uniref:DUF4177 domain-containing protein n=1 Tax=Halorussus aquaticus TaxID=2953748 RepID=A0ABD5PXK5_9EURY|nr:DUF4177 domain-containing protein [Halorussus aquaticus]